MYGLTAYLMILQHFISPLLHGTWMVIQPILWCVQGKAWNTAQQIDCKSDNEHIQPYISVCAVCKLFLLLLRLKLKTQSTMINEYSVIIISSNSTKTIQTSKFRVLIHYLLPGSGVWKTINFFISQQMALLLNHSHGQQNTEYQSILISLASRLSNS